MKPAGVSRAQVPALKLAVAAGDRVPRRRARAAGAYLQGAGVRTGAGRGRGALGHSLETLEGKEGVPF